MTRKTFRCLRAAPRAVSAFRSKEIGVAKRVLLVGGTGPSGVPTAQGIVERGHELTLFHRGLHEPEGLPDCEHIHADPHFRETIDEALAGRNFDVVIATYGRLRHVAEAMAGRCEQFISVGAAASNAGFLAPWNLRPYGASIPAREDEDQADHPYAESDIAGNFSHKIWRTEQTVFDLDRQGRFNATHFRYPRIYGPRQPYPAEWSIVKRVADRRPHLILADGGLAISSRLAARNAAEHLLLALDHPAEAAGQAFQCADDKQFTWRQIVETIVDIMGGETTVFSMPHRLAKPAWPLESMHPEPSHFLADTTKAKSLLGYHDAVSPTEAIRQQVEWLLANPIPPETYDRDPFDYAAEDRLIAAYERLVLSVQEEAPYDLPAVAHGYAHPKKPSLLADEKGR